jgi:hypothetical protein
LATISSWLTLGPLGTGSLGLMLLGSHARLREAGMLTLPR